MPPANCLNTIGIKRLISEKILQFLQKNEKKGLPFFKAGVYTEKDGTEPSSLPGAGETSSGFAGAQGIRASLMPGGVAGSRIQLTKEGKICYSITILISYPFCF